MTEVVKAPENATQGTGPTTTPVAAPQPSARVQLRGKSYVQQKQALSPQSTAGGAQHGKAEVKQVVVEMLGLAWMSQSQGKSPIQLTPGLTTVLLAATTLSAADLQLLWRAPPKTPKAAINALDHSLRGPVDAATMARLNKWKMSLVLGGTVQAPASATPATGAAAVSGIDGKEEVIKALVAALHGKKPEEKSAGTEAAKATLKALLETATGKKIKATVLAALISKKGRPFTAIVGTAALGALIATNSSLPALSGIPIGDNLSVSFELQGPLQRPTGVSIGFKFTLGGGGKEKKESDKPQRLELPKELHAYIGKIDRKTVSKWIIDRAHWEWDMAGPDDEQEKLAFYQRCKKNPDSLPDAQAIAEGLCRKLFERATENKIKALQGKGADPTLLFDLKHGGDKFWARFSAVQGLKPRLAWMLGLVAPNVPYQAYGIETVRFGCGAHTPISVPLKLKKPDEKATATSG